MSWLDDVAADAGLAWWIADRDRDREQRERAREREEAERAEAERVQREARERDVNFRRALAFAAAPIAAQRWDEYAATAFDPSGPPVPEEAARYLISLGFTPRAALASLRYVGSPNGSTEETVIAALLTQPVQVPNP